MNCTVVYGFCAASAKTTVQVVSVVVIWKHIMRSVHNEGSSTDSVGNAAYRMVEDFVEDKIREFWTNGWEYAQSYYDQLNEIRIVTGQTAEEAAQMGKVYRNMAKEMSVSSTEIASAAVEFWRQGLDESEVNSRLKNTTQYAKISGLEFQEAAELVTAATNSMNLDAQRVVDVFAYLGDASASGNPLISHLAQRCAWKIHLFGKSPEKGNSDVDISMD